MKVSGTNGSDFQMPEPGKLVLEEKVVELVLKVQPPVMVWAAALEAGPLV